MKARNARAWLLPRSKQLEEYQFEVFRHELGDKQSEFQLQLQEGDITRNFVCQKSHFGYYPLGDTDEST